MLPARRCRPMLRQRDCVPGCRPTTVRSRPRCRCCSHASARSPCCPESSLPQVPGPDWKSPDPGSAPVRNRIRARRCCCSRPAHRAPAREPRCRRRWSPPPAGAPHRHCPRAGGSRRFAQHVHHLPVSHCRNRPAHSRATRCHDRGCARSPDRSRAPAPLHCRSSRPTS